MSSKVTLLPAATLTETVNFSSFLPEALNGGARQCLPPQTAQPLKSQALDSSPSPLGKTLSHSKPQLKMGEYSENYRHILQ